MEPNANEKYMFSSNEENNIYFSLTRFGDSVYQKTTSLAKKIEHKAIKKILKRNNSFEDFYMKR